jgi:uncharacterized protein YigE (DUF2233 family)
MKLKTLLPLLLILLVAFAALGFFYKHGNDKIISYTVDTEKSNIEFYWKDKAGQSFRNIQALKRQLEKDGKKLKFAMNGGMFVADNVPLGLYIENGKIITPLDTNSGDGNFYMKPNGVFYITKNNKAHITESEKMLWVNDVKKFATQSGPMLLINGKMHPAFKEGSTNLQIRNGVGILPDGKVVFAISKEKINFYDFAKFFQELGCKNALYLDGYVSRMYCPQENVFQTDGDFGVIIGEWESSKSTK